MSVSAASSSDKTLKKPSGHRRNKSGDLDVFKAARYFSAIAEKQSIRGGRISLDVPVRSLLIQETHDPPMVKQQVHKEKKHSSKHPKPSSPGARLATFLNSIFHKSGSGKKKAKSVKEEEESPGGRRRRPRSSVSHFRCSSTSNAKSYQDLGTYPKVNQSGSQDGERDRHNTTDLSWLDEKVKLIESYTEKQKRNLGTHHEYIGKKETLMRRSIEVHEGAESDSSSDLFELENCDLGLPVYETTNMDDIKRGAPISGAPVL